MGRSQLRRVQVKQEGKAKRKTFKRAKPAWLKKRTGGGGGRRRGSRRKVNVGAKKWRVDVTAVKDECDAEERGQGRGRGRGRGTAAGTAKFHIPSGSGDRRSPGPGKRRAKRQ